MASAAAVGYAPTKKSLRSRLQRINTWRYTDEKRDLRLDLLRGFAALAMIIDHVGGDGSWLYNISGGNRFFVSAAEGFVFVSGLVMGIVYAGVIARYGLRAALIKGAKRVGTLYCLAVGLSLLFAGISLHLGLSWAPHIAAGGFFDFVTGILTLHRAFYLTDVMILYTFVVAVSLPLLAILSRGRWYSWLVLAGSWSLWAAFQFWPKSLQIPWAIADGAEFPFAAWQVLFVTGLALGYRRKALAGKKAASTEARPHPFRQWALLMGTGLAFASSIALYFWIQAHTGEIITLPQVADLFGKIDLGLGRLVIFTCLFGFAYLATTLLWTPIKRLFGWLLLPLGQDALTVYMLHLFVLALASVVSFIVIGTPPYSTPGNTLLQAAAILTVWGVITIKARRETANHTAKARVSQPTEEAQPRPREADLARSGNKGGWRLGLAGFAALVVTGAGLLAIGPGLSLAQDGNSASLPAANGSVRAFGTALPVPTGGRSFAMIVSGTAEPSLDTPTPVVLPTYVQERTFYSEILEGDMPYYVYLPPSYNSKPDARYPVLYMLHGMSGTNTEWLGYGLLGRARDMMSAGQIGEYIIVLPQGDHGYWLDQANGGPAWGTYVARDLVNEVDAKFRTLGDSTHRAVGGLSMGGYGALELGILFPNVFGVVGAHSPTLHTQDTAPLFFGDEAYFDAHDPVHLYQEHPEIARTLKIWMDVGSTDNWMPSVSAFQQQLQAAGIPDQWHTSDGGHDGIYWSSHVPDYLQFYSSALVGYVQQSTKATPTAIPIITTVLGRSVPTFVPATDPNSKRPPRSTLQDDGQ